MAAGCRAQPMDDAQAALRATEILVGESSRPASVAHDSAAQDCMALRKTGLIRIPQPSPPPNQLCQCTDYGFAPAIQSRAAGAREEHRFSCCPSAWWFPMGEM